MLDKRIVSSAIKMAGQGASQKDLHTFLCIPKSVFQEWYFRGYELVEAGYTSINSDMDRDDLCHKLYVGIQKATWGIKQTMLSRVLSSDNPQVAMRFLEGVYAPDFDPKYAEMDSTYEDAASGTSFVLTSFYDDEDDKDNDNENEE